MRIPKLKLKITKRKIAVVLLIATVPLMAAASWATPKGAEHHDHQASGSESAFSQETHRQLVDTAEGAPQTGRDPSRQQQSSLSDAASSPTASGKQSDKPAADVQGDHDHHATHGDVFADSQATGIGVSGCYIDYGIQGQQCLPAHVAGDDKKLTCHEVHTKFPSGIKVTGKDRFQLDTNGDGTACNNGD